MVNTVTMTYNKQAQGRGSILFRTQPALYDIIFFLVASAFLCCIWFASTITLNRVINLMFFTSLYISYQRKQYPAIFYYFTFFMFLFSSVFFGLFNEDYKYPFPNEAIERHVLIALGTSIFGTYFAGIHCRQLSNLAQRADEPNKTMISLKMSIFLRYASIVCGIFELIETIAKAIFVKNTTYISYYTDYKTPLPYFVVWFAAVAPFVFYLYLGSFPKKKDANIPITLYILCGFLSLLYGQRNVLVIRALLIFTYFLLRNKYYFNHEIWISKKTIVFSIFLVPFAISFMSFWDYYRSRDEINDVIIYQDVIAGLAKQGNDISILEYEYEFRNDLPDRLFALGGVISTLHNNVISQLLGIKSIPSKANTVETALDGYAFSCSLMYFQNRPRYLAGYGIGSCYIAELMYCFGYLGIGIGSFIYGIILKKVEESNLNGFIFNGICLLMFQMILLAPRASFDGFLTSAIQANKLFIILLCYILNKYVWPREVNG